MDRQFSNESPTNFDEADARNLTLKSLTAVRAQLGREYDLIIGGQHLRQDPPP